MPIYSPGKPIEDVAREYGLEHVIKLASNENPLGPSPLAIQALQQCLQDLHFYPDGPGYYLKQKLSHVCGVADDQIILGNGSNDIIEMIAKTYLNSGDQMVIADQAFVVYRIVGNLMDVDVHKVPLKNYTHDLSAMAKAVNAQTKNSSDLQPQ